MSNIIINKQTAKHSIWGQDCESWALVDTEGLSIKQEIMLGGTKEKLHFHKNAQQFFYILNGSATFYLDEKKIIVPSCEGVLIHPNSRHFIANETAEQLNFLVISQPTTNNDRITIETN